MANVIIDDTYLTGIANAIRTKTGGSDTYTPAQMATAIGNISGGNAPVQTLKRLVAQKETYASNCSISNVGQYIASSEDIIAIVWSSVSNQGDSYIYYKSCADTQIAKRSSSQVWMPIYRIGTVNVNNNGNGWASPYQYSENPVVRMEQFLQWDSTNSIYTWKTFNQYNPFTPELKLCSSSNLNSYNSATAISESDWNMVVIYQTWS